MLQERSDIAASLQLEKECQAKITKQGAGQFTFWICSVQDAPQKTQCCSFFFKAPRVSGDLLMRFGYLENTQSQQERFAALCILKKPYAGCSVKGAISYLV